MTKIRTIKVGQDAITGGNNPHYALVSDRKVVAIGTKQEMLELNQKTDGRVWLTHAKVDEVVEGKRPGLWANMHAKRKRGEKPAKKGDKDYPSDDAIRKARGESVEENNSRPPRPRKGRMSPAELEIMKLHNYHQTLKPGSQERKNVLNVINKKRKAVYPNKPPIQEALPAAAIGLALKAAPTVAKFVSRGGSAPVGAAIGSAYNTAKKGVKKAKSYFKRKRSNESVNENLEKFIKTNLNNAGIPFKHDYRQGTRKHIVKINPKDHENARKVLRHKLMSTKIILRREDGTPLARNPNRMKEDISTATTTASIPNPAVTAMGRMPTYILRRKKGIGIKMTDNRFNKKKPPVLLARFRKYMTDNGG